MTGRPPKQNRLKEVTCYDLLNLLSQARFVFHQFQNLSESLKLQMIASLNEVSV